MSLEGPPGFLPDSSEQSDHLELSERQDSPANAPSTPQPDRSFQRKGIDHVGRIVKQIDKLVGDPRLLPPTEYRIVGKVGFDWEEELSENGRWLYELLIGEQGDVDFLLTYANEEGMDLKAALDELRAHDLLDETNPNKIRLVSNPK